MLSFRQKVRTCNNFEILKKATEVWDNRKNVDVVCWNRTNTIKCLSIDYTNIIEVIVITCCSCTTPKIIVSCFENSEKYLMFLIFVFERTLMKRHKINIVRGSSSGVFFRSCRLQNYKLNSIRCIFIPSSLTWQADQSVGSVDGNWGQ